MNAKYFASMMLAGLAVSLAALDSAHAQTQTLRLGHTLPEQSLTNKAANKFAELVKANTNGRYAVQVFHSGQAGNDGNFPNLLRLGGLDLALTGAVAWGTAHRPLNLTSLPYIVETFEQGWRFFDTSPWLKGEIEKFAAEGGVRIINSWEGGFRSFSTKTPFSSPADLRGRSIRIFNNDIIQWTMSSLGLRTVVMPVTEAYVAIQQGVVDGQENAINDIHSRRFYEVAPNVVLTAHMYNPYLLGISEKTWRAMPKDAQESLVRAANEAGMQNRREIKENDEILIADMAKHGAKIGRVNVEEFRKAIEPVYEQARTGYGRESVNTILAETKTIRDAMPRK